MAIVSAILSLALRAGLALLFGFIANHVLRRDFPARFAGYAPAFPFALIVTKRKPAGPNQSVFD